MKGTRLRPGRPVRGHLEWPDDAGDSTAPTGCWPAAPVTGCTQPVSCPSLSVAGPRHSQPHCSQKNALLCVSNALWQTVLSNGMSLFPNVSLELSYAWIFNEYPSFVDEDRRRFVSQETGHLYIAKVQPSDVGNYTCVVTSAVTAASELGSPTPLVLRPDGET